MIQLIGDNYLLLIYFYISGRYPLYRASIFFIKQIFFLSDKSYRANIFIEHLNFTVKIIISLLLQILETVGRKKLLGICWKGSSSSKLALTISQEIDLKCNNITAVTTQKVSSYKRPLDQPTSDKQI